MIKQRFSVGILFNFVKRKFGNMSILLFLFNILYKENVEVGKSNYKQQVVDSLTLGV